MRSQQIKSPAKLQILIKILKEGNISYDALAFHLSTSSSKVCRAINGYQNFSPEEKGKIASLLGQKSQDIFK